MNYELFQQGPAVYLPILLLSFVVTVVAYGAFPFVFAKTRKKPITGKKYRSMCYGINAAVMFAFVVLNSGVFNAGPYILWTWVWTTYGTKALSKRGIIREEEHLSTGKQGAPNGAAETLSADAYRIKSASSQGAGNKVPGPSRNGSFFCKYCGTRLMENAVFCHECGSRISE